MKFLKVLSQQLFMAIAIGACMFSCQNNQTKPLFTTFSMPKHELITSLDKLNKDTLLVGTDQGNLYYYCPTTGEDPVDTLVVSEDHRQVYCVYPTDSGLFVGVSNEGLKLFSTHGKRDRKPKHKYMHPTKKDQFAIYKVVEHENMLYCATSNGLARLDLSKLDNDTLEHLYPKNIGKKLPEYRIKRLNVDSTGKGKGLIEIYHNDSILVYDIGKDRISQSRHISNASWKDTVSLGNVTYKFRQYDTKFYAYSNELKTKNPHNFVYATRLDKNKIIAIADDDGINKDVYIGVTEDSVTWNRNWTRRFKDVPGQITDLIFFPNKSCLILTSDEIAYRGDINRIQPLKVDTSSLKTIDSTTEKPTSIRFESVYYDTNHHKLYIALGAGFIYYNLDNTTNNPIWDSAYFVDYKDSDTNSYAFRCFTEWNNKICCGTIDDGCLLLNSTDKKIDSLPYIKNIRFLKHVKNKNLYVLTNKKVYAITDPLTVKDSIGNSYIRKLFYANKNKIFGVSSGHIYYHNENDTGEVLACFSLDPTIGHVNPYAIIDDYDSLLYIGTDNGLYYSKEGDLNNLKPVSVHDTFWKTHDPWRFILAGVIVLVLILGYILYRFMKQRHLSEQSKNKGLEKKLKTAQRKIKGTKKQVEAKNKKLSKIKEGIVTEQTRRTKAESKLRNEIKNELTRYSNVLAWYNYLESNNLLNDEKSEDWVFKISSKFKEKFEEFEDNIKKPDYIEEKDSIEIIKTEIRREMLPYAFAVELLYLRVELRREQLTNEETVKNVFDKANSLINNYLEEIVLCNDSNKERKAVLQHLWIIALLSEGEKPERLIDNTIFSSTYFKLSKYWENLYNKRKQKNEEPNSSANNNVSQLLTRIRKAIDNNTGMFQAKSKDFEEVFNDIVGFIKLVLEEHTDYEVNDKKVLLEEITQWLSSCGKSMSIKNSWVDIVDNIKINKKEKSKKVVIKCGDVEFKGKELPEKVTEAYFTEQNNKIIFEGKLDSIKTIYKESLMNIFNIAEENTIRYKLNKLKETVSDYYSMEKRDNKKQKDWRKDAKNFYNNYFVQIFEQPVSDKEDFDGVLLMWMWYLLVNGNSDWNKEEYRLKLIRDMWGNKNLDDTKVENWNDILKNDFSELNPKDKYEQLIDEWKKVIPKNQN